MNTSALSTAGKTPSRLFAAVVAITVIFGSASLVSLPRAEAQSRVVTVNTGGGHINVRSGPGTSYSITRTIPNQTRVTITCHLRGEYFRGGPYGVNTNIWNKLDSGGYVTDAMLETGSNNPIVPVCSSGTTTQVAASPNRPRGATRTTNPGAVGNCTWGAAQKTYDAARYYPALTGNAHNWDNSAKAVGWKVVTNAEPRSIVVFEPGIQGASSSGHVAWVDRVEQRPDGRYIYITEMNGWSGHGGGFNKWNTRTVKSVSGMSYILIP